MNEIQLKVTSLTKEKGEPNSESERLSTLVDSLNGRVMNMTIQFKQEQMINDGFRNFREEESTVFGQPASSKMLLSHLLILSLVGVTINGQVRGTFTCSRNPDAGATTSKAEAHTTNVGATTTEAGTTTTKAGTTTTKDGATTTKAEAPTTTPGATTTKTGTPTNKAGATTTKAGAITTKAGATTSKAEAHTTNVGATTTEAGTTTTKAGTTTTKAGTTTTKDGATTTKAEAPTTTPGATTTKTGTPTNKAGATTTGAGATTTKAGANTTKAGATTTKAGTTTTRAGTTTTGAGTTTTKTGATTTKTGATTTKTGTTTTKTGTTTAGAGTTTAEAGTTTAEAGTTTAEAGTTTAEAGTTTAEAGTTTAEAGTTTAEAGTTTAEAGTTTAEAGTTTAEAGTTTAEAGATTTEAEATTTKAGTPTTKAAATTTKARATTNKAGMNKARACSSMSIVNGSLTDCRAIYKAGCRESGIYNITPNGWTEDPFEAYCDMEILTDRNWCRGHGWTVFQRRVNGSVDFSRNWTSYKDGFGQLDHEFWLGNEKLHYLAKQNGKHRLLIEIVSSSGTTYYACYEEFHIKEEGEKYELHASTFPSTRSLMDGLSNQIGKAFSTYDRDNTENTNNCADVKQGGWWHEACNGVYTNLNGVYGSKHDSTSFYWKGLPNKESIISSEMKTAHCKNCN
ncbi:uncharacterized protein [Apostichopus japonicus]|uniref:uncharacterized protein isoform X2 n=1 Tax=Stichopus japonicus TaxID=307972 RepID=UPI003AB682AE